MDAPGTTLRTIGYEGAILDDFVATLVTHSVTTLIDIREVAISRRPGFAKRALSAALGRAGIAYVHLRGLGDPKEGREAARRNDHDRFVQVFSTHLLTAAAQEDLGRASEIASAGGACLMCYERDHSSCHRSLVAAAISATVAVHIRHLNPEGGIAHRRVPVRGALARERA